MEVGMESRWGAGICLGIITGGIALPLVGTIFLACTGDVLFLYYESYVLPALILEGGTLGVFVSPLVIVLFGNRLAPVTVARVGVAAALGAVAATVLAISLMVLLNWSDGTLPDFLRMDDISILTMPCMAGAAGFVIGGVVAMRLNRMKTIV
jgi:hypothetical protein